MRSRNVVRFCPGVRKAITDERAAAQFYGQLARVAPTSRAAATIRSIRRDEIRHRRQFIRLLNRWCR